jgi:hypothetical protein
MPAGMELPESVGFLFTHIPETVLSDLANQNGCLFQGSHCVSSRWNLFLEVILVSRMELHPFGAIGLGDRLEAVPLKLEQPALALERIAHKPRHHRCDHLFVRGLGD